MRLTQPEREASNGRGADNLLFPILEQPINCRALPFRPIFGPAHTFVRLAEVFSKASAVWGKNGIFYRYVV